MPERARLLEQHAERGRPVAPAEQAALWLSHRGTRLTTRAIDLVTIAGLAGHARLDTTRRYTLPSEADRQAAIDAVQVEY